MPEKENTKMAWRCLPEELVEQIMAKLPVKSLSRFKCVNKVWSDLIVSSDFKTLHYHCSIEKPYTYLTPRICLLNSNAEKLDFHMCKEIVPYGGRVIGSASSGLVCIRLWLKSKWNFAVWNPATRECRLLPKPVVTYDPENTNCAGFDFNPCFDACDNYKVGIICFYHGRSKSYKVGVYLYSKSSNSWKKIEKLVPSMRVWVEKCVTYNGSIYWPAVEESVDTPPQQYVACFDMWREKFTRITAPCCDDEYLFRRTLVTLNGGSSLAMFNNTGDCFDGWVMNEEDHSWSKHFSIVPKIPASTTLKNTIMSGLWLKGGYVIDTYRDRGTYLYDQSTGNLKYAPYGRHLFRYNETLFSPF